MAITVTLFGVTRTIPQTKERNWGAQVTSILEDLANAANATMTLLAGQGIPARQATDSTLAAAATLTQTHAVHRVAGTPGAVTLDATTAIADGSTDGVGLVLIGTNNTNTVTLPDAANTRLNGTMVLGQGDAIWLRWNDTASEWVEIARNN